MLELSNALIISINAFHFLHRPPVAEVVVNGSFEKAGVVTVKAQIGGWRCSHADFDTRARCDELI